MDAIKEASNNVSGLLNEKFANPPTPIRSIRKQKNRAKSKIDDFYTTVDIKDIIDVFEVWKIVLDNKSLDEVFIIISAKCTMAGFRNVKWSDVKYRGFYSTVDEALSTIYSSMA